MKTHILLTAILSVAAQLLLPAPAKAAPNVIVIFVDDLGWPDLGVQGATDLLTPHIDSLATNGVRFTSGYVTCPVCSPSRAGLMTGRHQQRFGYEMNPGPALEYDPIFGLPLTEHTLGNRMKERGYATGWIGKSHLGAAVVPVSGANIQVYHPVRRGFDEFFGFLEGHHAYCQEGTCAPNLPDPIHRATAPLSASNPIIPVNETAYLTNAFGREIVDFIDRHQSHPFCIYAPFNAVHEPVTVTDTLMDDTKHLFPGQEGSLRHKLSAMLHGVDRAVGLTLAKLESIPLHPENPADTRTLVDNTLIFFSSDNGAPPADRDDRNGSVSFPLRGNKSSVYEGGIRVPYIMQWRGTLPAGGVVNYPVSTMDILPTCVAASGGIIPAAWQLDGVNLLPYLDGPFHTAAPGAVPHPNMFWRVETGRDRDRGPRAMRQGRWKLVKPSWDANWELYDLEDTTPPPLPAGFREETGANLASSRPDILAQLLPLFEAWEATLATPGWDYNTPYYTTPTFVLEDTRLGSTTDSYLAPEFLPGSNQLAFQDGTGTLWRGTIDLLSGRLTTANGREIPVDTNVTAPSPANEGPQWGVSAAGASLFYTKPGAGSRLQVWRSGVQLTSNTAADSFGARVSQDPSAASVKMAFNRGTLATSAAIVANETAPAVVAPLPNQATVDRNGRWIPGTSDVVYVRTSASPPLSNQLARFNTTSGTSVTLTDEPGMKSDAWAFFAPEFDNELCYAAVIDRVSLVIYRDRHRPDGIFDREAVITLPAGETAHYLAALKPVQGQRGFNGTSYFTCAAHENIDLLNPGASAVWLLGFGPDAAHRLPHPPQYDTEGNITHDLCIEWIPLVQRLDAVSPGVVRDVETVIGEREVFCYYTRDDGVSPSQLRMTRTGLVRPDWPSAATGFTTLPFTKDYPLVSPDATGWRLGGTETTGLVAHDGKLFAAIGSYGDYPLSGTWVGAQILSKNSPTDNWHTDTGADTNLFRQHRAVEVLKEITFTKQDTIALPAPVKHLIASLSDVTAIGGTTVSARTRVGSGAWEHSTIATTAAPAYALTFATHLDRDADNIGGDDGTPESNAGREQIFAGLTNGAVYRGIYQFGASGRIAWDTTAELLPTTLGPVTAIADVNGILYAACGKRQDTAADPVTGGLYKRDDHTDTWSLVYSWSTPLPVYSTPADERVITSLTNVPDPRGCGHNILLAARSWPGVIERIDPERGDSVSVELDVRDFFARHWNTPGIRISDVRVGYTGFTPFTDPVTGENVHLLGLWISHPSTGAGSYFLVRHLDGTYEPANIATFTPALPPAQTLRASRCMAVSPFAGDAGSVFYFGGYETAGEESHDTAWIARGGWTAWPTLTISRPEPPSLQLTWPATSAEWFLESSTTLAPGSWQPDPRGPTYSIFDTTLSVFPNTTQMFFRLRRR